MSELPPDTRAFLEHSRSVHQPSADDRARVLTALRGRIVLPVPTTATTTSATTATTATAAKTAVTAAKAGLLATTASKVLVGALLVVSGGVAVGTYDRAVLPSREVALSRSPAASAPASAPAPTPPPPATVTARLPEVPPVEDAPVAAATTEPVAAPSVPPATSARSFRVPSPPALALSAGTPAPAASSAPDAPDAPPADAPVVSSATLAREVALLRAAEDSLRRGDARAAMASLDEHQRSFPDGALREERRATRALALCALGDGDRAAAEASALREEAPRSPYADRLRASCAGWPAR